MRENIIKSIVKWTLKEEYENERTYEICSYGLELMWYDLINVLTTIIIGSVFNEFLAALIYFISFRFLRSYAGGYHAKTAINCYLLTSLSMVVSLSVIKWITINLFYQVCLSMISGLVILTLAPIDTENKRIDEIERIHYRIMTICIWSIEVVIFVLGIFFFSKLSKVIVIVFLATSISLIMGKVCRELENLQ